MPLYTFRVRWSIGGALDRGSDPIEWSMHFLYPNDLAAHDDLHRLVALVQDYDASNRWTVARGDGNFHEAAMYRRTSATPNSWVKINDEAFTMAAWQEFGASIPGTSIPAGVAERPMFPHQAGAVLTTLRTSDPLVERRIYVGPLSKILLFASVPGSEYFTSTTYTNILNGSDQPFDPNEDTIDLWDERILTWVQEFIGSLHTGDGGGTPVVASWQHNTVLPVTSIAVSRPRAELRSRRARGGAFPPLTIDPGSSGGGGSW